MIEEINNIVNEIAEIRHKVSNILGEWEDSDGYIYYDNQQAYLAGSSLFDLLFYAKEQAELLLKYESEYRI